MTQHHRCCRHCDNDPAWHTENSPHTHTTSCLDCDREAFVAERLTLAGDLTDPVLIVVDAGALRTLTDAVAACKQDLTEFGEPSLARLPAYDELRADHRETIADAAEGLLAHLRPA